MQTMGCWVFQSLIWVLDLDSTEQTMDADVVFQSLIWVHSYEDTTECRQCYTRVLMFSKLDSNKSVSHV